MWPHLTHIPTYKNHQWDTFNIDKPTPPVPHPLLAFSVTLPALSSTVPYTDLPLSPHTPFSVKNLLPPPESWKLEKKKIDFLISMDLGLKPPMPENYAYLYLLRFFRSSSLTPHPSWARVSDTSSFRPPQHVTSQCLATYNSFQFMIIGQVVVILGFRHEVLEALTRHV